MNGLRLLAHRFRLAVSIGRVLLTTDPIGGFQRLQLRVLGGELRDDIPRLQEYGHASRPLEGARAVLVTVGGNRTDLVCIACDDSRYRPELEPGEAAIYNHLGDFIRIRNGRIVEVVAGTAVTVTAPEATFNCASKVTLNTPLLEVSGAILAGGNVQSAAQVIDATGSMQAMRGIYNGHQHGSGPTPTPVMS